MRARLIVCWRVGVHTKSGLFRGSGEGGIAATEHVTLGQALRQLKGKKNAS